jgi:hypothetical protein
MRQLCAEATTGVGHTHLREDRHLVHAPVAVVMLELQNAMPGSIPALLGIQEPPQQKKQRRWSVSMLYTSRNSLALRLVRWPILELLIARRVSAKRFAVKRALKHAALRRAHLA